MRTDPTRVKTAARAPGAQGGIKSTAGILLGKPCVRNTQHVRLPDARTRSNAGSRRSFKKRAASLSFT